MLVTAGGENKTLDEFQSKGNYFEKLLHLLENVNFPVLYRDWDQGSHSVAEFRRRYSNTEREMVWSFMVTFNTLLMFTPLFCTGNVGSSFVDTQV